MINQHEQQGDAKKIPQEQDRDRRDKRLLLWMKDDLNNGFNRLAEVYWKQLCSVAYGVLRDSGLSYLTEDVVQDGLLNFYQLFKRAQDNSPKELAKKLNSIKHLRAYLYTSIRNQAILCLKAGDQTLELRDGQPNEQLSEDITDRNQNHYGDPEYQVERAEYAKETYQLTQDLLNRITPLQQTIIKRRYFSNHEESSQKIPYSQIAKEMNIPIGTVKSEASRGKTKMHKLYMQNKLQKCKDTKSDYLSTKK